MALVLRGTKGSRLTTAEMDANLSGLADGTLLSFTQPGTGALTTRTVQAALRAMVRTGDYDTAGHFNTAQAALTETIGAYQLRLGTGVFGETAILFPSQGAAPGAMGMGGALSEGVFNPVLGWGYNPYRAVTTEPQLWFVAEGNYVTGGVAFCEYNANYISTDGLTNLRFLSFDVRRDTHVSRWAFAAGTIRLESVINAAEIVLTPVTGLITRSVADGAVTTAATSVVALSLKNTTGGNGTVSPSIGFDVGGGGGGAKIYTSRLSGAGGVLHFATDTTGTVMTDAWAIDEAQNFVQKKSGAEILIGTTTALGTAGYGIMRLNGTTGGSVDFLVNGTRKGTVYMDAANGLALYSEYGVISFQGAGAALVWQISGNNILAGNDNLYDIGASGATRPRTLYLGTNIIASGASGSAIGAATSSTTALNLAAGTTGVSSLRIPHGAAPTSPVNGDIWTTSAGGLFVRINGVTVGPLT